MGSGRGQPFAEQVAVRQRCLRGITPPPSTHRHSGDRATPPPRCEAARAETCAGVGGGRGGLAAQPPSAPLLDTGTRRWHGGAAALLGEGRPVLPTWLVPGQSAHSDLGAGLLPPQLAQPKSFSHCSSPGGPPMREQSQALDPRDPPSCDLLAGRGFLGAPHPARQQAAAEDGPPCVLRRWLPWLAHAHSLQTTRAPASPSPLWATCLSPGLVWAGGETFWAPEWAAPPTLPTSTPFPGGSAQGQGGDGSSHRTETLVTAHRDIPAAHRGATPGAEVNPFVKSSVPRGLCQEPETRERETETRHLASSCRSQS